MTAIYQYFLAFSSISKSALLANPAYNIENFPYQSDQTNPGLGWTEPHRELTQRPTPARVTQNADLSQTADGFYTFQWGFAYWTTGQLAYLLNTAFGGANGYALLSIPVTVQTYADSGYVAFRALLARPIWGTSFRTQDGGYENVVLKFARGVVIT